MRSILIFIDNLGSGGAQRRAINIANLLLAKHYDVAILTYHRGVFYDDAVSNIRIDLVEETDKKKRLRLLLKYLKKCRRDVVISFMDSPNYIACLAKIFGAKWRLITTESSARESSFKGKKKYLNYLEKKTDYKVCNSENALNMWLDRYSFIRDKIGVIYNPVIISEDFNKKIEMIDNHIPRTIIVVASYQHLKNPLRLVRAMARLSEKDKKRLVINWFGRIEPTPGNREAYDETKKLVDYYDLNNCIHLYGETKDIYRMIDKSDAVGLFSTVEGLPNAICEGMMLKKPVIMSMVSDYKILVDGNGFLCDAYDEESIANALHQFVNSDWELIRKMSDKSYIIAKKLFSPDEIIKQWIQIIGG